MGKGGPSEKKGMIAQKEWLLLWLAGHKLGAKNLRGM